MLEQVSIQVRNDGLDGNLCRHHWVIEVAAGPVSNGYCMRCEIIREFKNYIERAPRPEDDEIVEVDEPE